MKRLVLCGDGTWNEPGQTEDGLPSPSNVAKTAAAILPEDSRGVPQVAYYHMGVGERGGLWDHLTGGAFGVGISRDIQEMYLFLAGNYTPGDEIWLLGFSRGAYMVRSLAGLLRNCGILTRENLGHYKEAYELYRDRSAATRPDSPRANEFRRRYSWPDFRIRFIGVWDTVGALGIPLTPLRFWTKSRYEFHDVALSSHVDHAYQALAIDERRKPFLPAVWRRQPHSPEQVLEQAWFPGVHCNVGGGYADAGLSDGARLWIWDRAERCGLALDARLCPVPNPNGELRDSLTLFYRLLGDGTRRLGTQNPSGAEGIHGSVRARPGYGPRNLELFLRKDPGVYGP